MAQGLSALERTVTGISALAITDYFLDGLPALPLVASMVVFISLFAFAETTLLLFLLVVKNGDGWPQ